MERVREQGAGLDAYQHGDYATAIAAFTEARAAWASIGDTYAEAEALTNLGVAHQRMGNLYDAEMAYQEAMALFAKAGAIDGQAKVMGNLATLLVHRGQSMHAEGYLTQAADLFMQAGQLELEADTLRYLARLQLQRRAFLEALLSYDRALSRLPHLSGSQQLLRFLTKIFFKLVGIQS
ncbi:MAG: tetratricopeptide repeat protein [Ardenticatenaceae bacterium]|nr:tetratricopeptide repeat protein [Ardenticatenaceae bacterium]